jgi:CheY-like chemotaxis protein
VLVVDDNVDAAELLAESLDLMGYTTRIAHDGPTALRIAAELKPEIALLDIGLLAMDGYELARLLRGQPELARICLVAVTGYGQESDRRKRQGLGVQRRPGQAGRPGTPAIRHAALTATEISSPPASTSSPPDHPDRHG